MFKIGRHINGITLNPLEWLEDNDGNLQLFETQEQAEKFLLDNGETQDGLEWYTFEEVKEQVKFYGIDRFNRPVFKSLDTGKGKFYGDVNNLFGYEATEAEVLDKVTVNDLCYFGSRFDCEPYGTPVNNLKIEGGAK